MREGTNDGLPDGEGRTCKWREAGCLDRETRAFTRSKYACTPDSRALYTLAPAAATGWKGQKSLTPNPKLKALTRSESPGRYRSGQTGQTVNLLAYAFSGSNPLLPMLENQRLLADHYNPGWSNSLWIRLYKYC